VYESIKTVLVVFKSLPLLRQSISFPKNTLSPDHTMTDKQLTTFQRKLLWI